MNSQEAFKYSLMISVALHLIFFLSIKDSSSSIIASSPVTVIDMDSIVISQPQSVGGVGIESFTPNPQGQTEAEVAQKKRKAYLEYIEEISQEIHSRRLSFGRTDLLGITTYSFIIKSDGSFSDVQLKISSGSTELDTIASQAIKSASKKVKRPKIIGDNPIKVVQEIRFQYGLK